jgi:Fur family transcriptional regulator, zinc uptake regulator
MSFLPLRLVSDGVPDRRQLQRDCTHTYTTSRSNGNTIAIGGHRIGDKGEVAMIDNQRAAVTEGSGGTTAVRDRAGLVSDAAALCEERNVRFTPARRGVFEAIARSSGPITAYQILDRLLAVGQESGPPTIYRALEFLIDQNLVHRVETLNAFVPCTQPRRHHACQLLICTDCGDTAELASDRVMNRLASTARGVGFSISAAVVELKGVCAACRVP